MYTARSSEISAERQAELSATKIMGETLEDITATYSRYGARIGRIEDSDVSIDKLLPQHIRGADWSGIGPSGDTIAFNRLIDELLMHLSPSSVSRLVDLGAGGSLPTLKAVIDSSLHSDLTVVAVDASEDELEKSRRNATKFSLQNRYSFVRADLESYLAELKPDPTVAIASNPPYVPCPPCYANVEATMASLVDGGPDGTRYLKRILTHSHAPGTYLALLFSSLSNPAYIFELVESNYTVLFLQALRTRFGPFTSSPVISSHLHKERSEGRAIFYSDADGKNFYDILGIIVQRL